MRTLVATAATAVFLGALAPVASHAVAAPHSAQGAARSRPARVADALEATLATATAGQPIVVFVHGTSPDAARRAVEHAGLTSLGEFESIGVPVAFGTPTQIAALAGERGVTYVEPNRAVRLLDGASSKAIRAGEAKALPYAGTPFTGQGQTVAVVDTGVDGTHPMFMKDGKSKVVKNLKVVCLDEICPQGSAAEPFIVDMTAANDTDTSSAGGHGTHVAGIAAGYPVTTADGQKLSGIAPGAKLVAISTGAVIGIYGADAGLDWIVRHHADPCGHRSCPPITVVNNSYGSVGEWDKESVTSKLQAKLIAAGVVVVWANGNGDELNDGGDGSDNRSGDDAQDPLPGVISVANYDDAGTGTREGTLDSSSSRGQKGRPASWPDLSAPGTNITSACRPYLAICTSGEADPNYGTISGTSMAAPAVAGAVAVLRQAAPSLTPAQVELTLQSSAHRFAFGAGYQPDPQNQATPSSFDKGHGLLDLTNAINLATGHPMTEPAGGAAAATCAPGAPIASDPEGDATAVASADLGDSAYEPGLDVLSVTAAGDPAKERLVVTLKVVDLSEAEPVGASGTSFDFALGLADESYDLDARRDASGATFGADGADVKGTFDVENDTITWFIPRKALTPAPFGTVLAKGVSAGYSRRSESPTPLGPVSDSYGGACPVSVNLGGAAPAPDGIAGVGAPYTWKGEPTTALSDPSGLGVADGAVVDGNLVDERTVNVTAGGTLVLHVLADNPAVDDYDIELFGPDGSPVGFGSDDPKQADGASAAGGGDETITVPHAAPGVYRVVVRAFATVESTYRGKVSVR